MRTRQLTHVWMIELLSLDRAVRNYQVGRLGVVFRRICLKSDVLGNSS